MRLFLIAAAILGVAGAAAGLFGLRRLRRPRPVTEADERAGLAGTWIQVDGCPVFVRFSRRSAAEGRVTVVLVHGMIISGRSMLPLARTLAPEFAVYAPDLPGFGESGRPPRVLDVEALADALHRCMQALGISQATFIGSSFGCQVVTALALRHPTAVERVVLLGPTVDPAARGLLKQVWRLLLNSRRESSPVLGRLSRIDYAKAGIRGVIGTIRITLRDRIEQRLPHVSQPTLVVRGSLDPVVPQAWADRATALLPQGRLVVIEGASHTLNVTHPRQLMIAIRPFLRGRNCSTTAVDR